MLWRNIIADPIAQNAVRVHGIYESAMCPLTTYATSELASRRIRGLNPGCSIRHNGAALLGLHHSLRGFNCSRAPSEGMQTSLNQLCTVYGVQNIRAVQGPKLSARGGGNLEVDCLWSLL
jgi:hypothetical protein